MILKLWQRKRISKIKTMWFLFSIILCYYYHHYYCHCISIYIGINHQNSRINIVKILQNLMYPRLIRDLLIC